MDVLRASHSPAFSSAFPVRQAEEGEAPPYTTVPLHSSRQTSYNLPLRPITYTMNCHFYRLNGGIPCVTCYGPEDTNIHGITRAPPCRAWGAWMWHWLCLCGTGVSWCVLMTNDDAGSGVPQQRQNMCVCVYRKAGVRGVSWCIHLLSKLYSRIVVVANTIEMYSLSSIYSNILIM